MNCFKNSFTLILEYESEDIHYMAYSLPNSTDTSITWIQNFLCYMQALVIERFAIQRVYCKMDCNIHQK